MKTTKAGIMIFLAVLIAAATLSLYPSFRSSAQTKPKPSVKKPGSNHDAGKSTPNSRSKMGDVDQQDIDKAMKEVEESMKQVSEIEWPKVQLEISKAMKEIDAVKIQKEIEASMKEIDMNAIKIEIDKAMAEVKENLSKVDYEKIKRDADKAINNIDLKVLQNKLAEVKKINSEQIKQQMELVKEQMENSKIDMKEQMEHAHEQIQLAKTQLQLVRDGLDELEKDGLKKKGEKISIEYKEGIMYLNGKPQSKEVSDKYKKYFGNTEGDFNEPGEPKNKELIK